MNPKDLELNISSHTLYIIVYCKVTCGVRTPADLLTYKEIGILRCEAAASESILEEEKKLSG